MSKRREFTKAVKVEIIKRASDTILGLACEKCGTAVKKFEIDHWIPDGLSVDKSAPLTAKDGMLLCLPCHATKTAGDVPSIAKAKRIEAKHIGATRPEGKLQSRGFQKKPRKHADRMSLPTKELYND